MGLWGAAGEIPVSRGTPLRQGSGERPESWPETRVPVGEMGQVCAKTSGLREVPSSHLKHIMGLSLVHG